MKRRLIVLITAWLLPLGAAAAAGGPVAEDAGVIQELDFAGNTMVIDGMSYRVAIDTRVEIGGSYGAFTMLRPGMRVYYEFEQHSPTLRILRNVRELPKDVLLEQN